MPRLSAQKRATARAISVRYGGVQSVPAKPSEETRARNNEVRACTASACVDRVSDAPVQAAELQRRWRIATLLDHHDGDDDDLISSTRNDALRRAGLPNLGNTCFINAALQRWHARCLLHASIWKQTRSLRKLPTLRSTPCLGCSVARTR